MWPKSFYIVSSFAFPVFLQGCIIDAGSSDDSCGNGVWKSHYSPHCKRGSAGAAALTAALSCDTLAAPPPHSSSYTSDKKTHSIIASYRDIYSHYRVERQRHNSIRFVCVCEREQFWTQSPWWLPTSLFSSCCYYSCTILLYSGCKLSHIIYKRRRFIYR